jgi:hypothetical protein
MYKLGYLKDGEWLEHSHRPEFSLPAAGAIQRVQAAAPASDPRVFLALAECLEGPLKLLYVLHTSRGEADLGRYQSPDLSFAELQEFVAEFRSFLTADARFDLWVHSPSQGGTVVWDRHDLLHAYGPLDCYADSLRRLGFTTGNPAIPAPHSHNYHQELDPLARRLMARYPWKHSALRPEDAQ